MSSPVSRARSVCHSNGIMVGENPGSALMDDLPPSLKTLPVLTLSRDVTVVVALVLLDKRDQEHVLIGGIFVDAEIMQGDVDEFLITVNLSFSFGKFSGSRRIPPWSSGRDSGRCPGSPSPIPIAR